MIETLCVACITGMVIVLAILYRCMSLIEALIKDLRLQGIAKADPMAGRIQSQEEVRGTRKLFEEITRLKAERERRLNDKKPKPPMMRTVGLVDTIGANKHEP